MPKIVYITHQLAGDLESNVKNILKICKEVHTKKIIPIAPYLVAVQYLNDKIIRERKLGIDINKEFFRRRVMDELWLCGPRISRGMKGEIKLSLEYKIPIMCYNIYLWSEFKSLKLRYFLKFPEKRFATTNYKNNKNLIAVCQ